MTIFSLYDFEVIFSNKLKQLLQTPAFSGDDFYMKKLHRCLAFTQWENYVADYILTYFKDKKILEIGCGAGQLSIYLKLKGVDIECCEVAESRYELASIMNKYFDANLTIFQKKYQDFSIEELLKYDLLVGCDITNTLNNNFLEDKKNLIEYVNTPNKYLLFDSTRYNYNIVDKEKKEMEEFFDIEKQKVFNNNKKNIDSLINKCKIQ